MRRIAASVGYAVLTLLLVPLGLAALPVWLTLIAGLTGLVWLTSRSRPAHR